MDRISTHAIISLYPDVNIPLTCSYQTEYFTNQTEYGVTDGFTEHGATAGQGPFQSFHFQKSYPVDGSQIQPLIT